MTTDNWGEAFRAAIGSLAFLAAFWQLVMRVRIVRDRHDPVGARERMGAVATALLLIGIGSAQLTHLTLAVSWSSVFVTAGIVLSLITNWRTHQATRWVRQHGISADPEDER